MVKINIRLFVCSIIHVFESLLTKIFIFRFGSDPKFIESPKETQKKKETTWSSGRRKNKQKMIKVNMATCARERRIDCANKNLRKEKNSFVEKCKLSLELNIQTIRNKSLKNYFCIFFELLFRWFENRKNGN